MPRVCSTAMVIAVCGALLSGSPLRADQLTLKDGTVLEGTVIEQADSYWIKTPDGQRRIIPFADVKSLNNGHAPGALAGVSGAFQAARRGAEAAESPVAALAIWQKFIDSGPSPSDRSAAAVELKRWQSLADDDAEKINGRWVGGPQRRQMMQKAAVLCDEAAELITRNQTLAAIRKLEEAVRAYPNCYQAIFSLGYLSLVAKDESAALRHFEHALRLKPDSSEALNNLGIAVLTRNDYARSIDLLYRAAQAEDNRVVAQNLVNVLGNLPPQAKDSPRFRAASDAARLLAGKYNIPGPSRNYQLIPPRARGKGGSDPELAGVRSAGSGFVIRDDGLILTNRHVAEGGNLLVLLPGNIRKSAEVVSIDQDQDLALIQIKPEGKLAAALLSPDDSPPEGAQCYVIGYPLIERMGASIKITQGIVSGKGRASLGTDIVVDAKVNPGNSGGPLVNSRGHVIGIVTMKSRSSETEDSYGLAISAGRIRRFLEKQRVTIGTASGSDAPLLAEQVVARLKDATVCVLSLR